MLPTDRRAGRLPLRRAIRALRDQTNRYKNLVLLSVFVLAVAVLLLGLTMVQRPDPVALGTGQAGVTELHAPFAPLGAHQIEAEMEPVPLETLPGAYAGSGAASFYGSEFAGRRTASGERFAPEGMTAAHRTLPFGSKVRVINRRNGRSIIVRINDRGPFHGNRVIDLSQAAARELGFLQSGTAPVELELLPVRS